MHYLYSSIPRIILTILLRLFITCLVPLFTLFLINGNDTIHNNIGKKIDLKFDNLVTKSTQFSSDYDGLEDNVHVIVMSLHIKLSCQLYLKICGC